MSEPVVRWDAHFVIDGDAIAEVPVRLTRVEAWLDDEQLARLRGLAPESLRGIVTEDTLVQVAIDYAHARSRWQDEQADGAGEAAS